MRLTQNWTFYDDTGNYSVPVSVPFDSVSALYDAGKIDDPYWGRNEYDLRWISERTWVAKRQFEVTDTNIELLAEGLDGVVDVVVNGTTVLSAENSFRSYRVDLSEVAKIGTNDIELQFRSVVAEGAARQAAQTFHIPGISDRNDGQVPIANGNMLRKTQCDFGWDWNIALAPFGVTGALDICAKTEARLDHLHIAQEHHDIESDSVTVIVTAHIAGDAEGDTVEMSFGGRTREAQVKGRVAQAKFFVEVPEFWWPAGQGMQPLYDLEVRMRDEVMERRVGLRHIELVVQEDDAGTSFKFKVNGREVFAKGANWIPADALSGRIDREEVRDLLQSAVDANMNMIRIWGGGRYEPTWFYDMCDEMGLMIWQDFMFSCNLYPADEAFLANVEAEVRENVRRMHHHACMALWCGDNELLGALTWFDESKANRDRYLVMYDRLNRTLEQALKDEDPNAIWWPSSPSPGYFNFGDGWHDDTSGDMHFWSVWHENRDFEHYRDIKPRFCSEFGFQSYPSNRIIETFTDAKDRNIAAPVFESHQKNAGGNERIAATMFRYFRFPVDFPNFVYLSQVQQGLAIKTAVTYWRSLKPHCMGALVWQLNDTWPVCSWSSLDYGGGWKLLHHMTQKFYAPVTVVVNPETGKDHFKVVNDTGENVDITVQIAAVNMHGVARPVADATLSAWASKALDLVSLDHGTLNDDEIYVFTWQTGAGEDAVTGGDIYAPKAWKTYDLVNPEIDHTILEVDGVYEITLRAQALGLFVAVEASTQGRMSNNAFAMLPNQEVKVTFVPQHADEKPQFTIRDLYTATYGAET